MNFMSDAIDRCANGAIAPHVALMRLFTELPDEGAARGALALAVSAADPTSSARLRAMQELWDRMPRAYADISAIHSLASCELRGNETARIRQLSELFDSAAEISPQASVALYSLGNADLLDEITREIVHVIKSWQLFDSRSRVLDIGCGTGRFLEALAPCVACVIGVDISAAMLHRARERIVHFDNAAVVQGSGRNVATFAANSFELVMAIDSFPYLVQAGVAEAHFEDCARVLKPRGFLLAMNFSYRDDPVRDRADVEALSRRFGFQVQRNGSSDLRLWDGATFLLQKT